MGCGVAVTAVVDEITTENDDCDRTGDSPVRAAVRSEPFVKPFAPLVPAVPKHRRAGHDRCSCFVAIMENTIGRELFPRAQNLRLTSLMLAKFISLQNRPC
jgi:hypothetical protein